MSENVTLMNSTTLAATAKATLIANMGIDEGAQIDSFSHVFVVDVLDNDGSTKQVPVRVDVTAPNTKGTNGPKVQRPGFNLDEAVAAYKAKLAESERKAQEKAEAKAKKDQLAAEAKAAKAAQDAAQAAE